MPGFILFIYRIFIIYCKKLFQQNNDDKYVLVQTFLAFNVTIIVIIWLTAASTSRLLILAGKLKINLLQPCTPFLILNIQCRMVLRLRSEEIKVLDGRNCSYTALKPELESNPFFNSKLHSDA